jgi:hypothetical protein
MSLAIAATRSITIATQPIIHFKGEVTRPSSSIIALFKLIHAFEMVGLCCNVKT